MSTSPLVAPRATMSVMAAAVMFALLCGSAAVDATGISTTFDDPVSCGSVIKLKNMETAGNGAMLHSHSINWGSGSGQQSVTSQGDEHDQSSLWRLKEAHGSEVCMVGEPIRCGQRIRFEHLTTRKNLHSHLFRSPLSKNQEVSCFGDGGDGDTGDNWEVVCARGQTHWERDQQVAFRHADTGNFLYTAKAHEFTQSNCGHQCPIMGQTEVSASQNKKGQRTQWMADEGVYFASSVKDGKTTEEEEEEHL